MSQKLDQIEKELTHKTQKSKIFIPDLQLLELADQIRDLKSTQIINNFTMEDGEHRCVMGALMVEKHGVKDNPYGIYSSIKSIPFLYERSIRWNFGNLSDTLANMNNHGKTFSDIADWVEDQAYKYGRME